MLTRKVQRSGRGQQEGNVGLMKKTPICTKNTVDETQLCVKGWTKQWCNFTLTVVESVHGAETTWLVSNGGGYHRMQWMLA